jgi:hypothetical protein
MDRIYELVEENTIDLFLEKVNDLAKKGYRIYRYYKDSYESKYTALMEKWGK